MYLCHHPANFSPPIYWPGWAHDKIAVTASGGDFWEILTKLLPQTLSEAFFTLNPMGYLAPPEGEILGDSDETLTPNLVGSIFHAESDGISRSTTKGDFGEILTKNPYPKPCRKHFSH